jgi:leucyl/phenylalanyl-tRNA--protein transferase
MYQISQKPPIYYLDDYTFPNPYEAFEDGFVGASSDLAPQRLLNGYSKGFFPWYQAEDGLFHWYNIDKRMILYTDKVKKTKKLLQKLRSANWDFRINTNFEEVIKNCSSIKRPIHHGDSWITNDFIEAYTNLHKLGFALSVESYFKDELVGGFYGVGIGNYFSGESMFAKKSDASKLALIYFCEVCQDNEIEWIDCQSGSEHLERMGAVKIDKTEFIPMLEKSIKKENNDTKNFG